MVRIGKIDKDQVSIAQTQGAAGETRKESPMSN